MRRPKEDFAHTVATKERNEEQANSKGPRQSELFISLSLSLTHEGQIWLTSCLPVINGIRII
jgi:hypothetical protein